jgi:P27 family predicted phage terminase small subunit
MPMTVEQTSTRVIKSNWQIGLPDLLMFPIGRLGPHSGQWGARSTWWQARLLAFEQPLSAIRDASLPACRCSFRYAPRAHARYVPPAASAQHSLTASLRRLEQPGRRPSYLSPLQTITIPPPLSERRLRIVHDVGRQPGLASPVGDTMPPTKGTPMSSPASPLDGAMPPSSMSTEAKAKWYELLPRLEALNIASQEHLDQLAVYCEAFATWHEATRRIQEHGHLARIGKSVFPSPWLGIRDRAVIQITRLATRLGFSPDAPLARRMPSFTEFAQETCAVSYSDGYEIVHGDGTIEVRCAGSGSWRAGTTSRSRMSRSATTVCASMSARRLSANCTSSPRNLKRTNRWPRRSNPIRPASGSIQECRWRRRCALRTPCAHSKSAQSAASHRRLAASRDRS